jgi:adenylate cyclase
MDDVEDHRDEPVEDERAATPVQDARGPRMRRAAARLDTQAALLGAARKLRRRLPGDEKFGDPLSTAGRAPVEVIARGVSALRPESESVSRELGLAGLQIWQSVSEAAGRGRGDLEMALLFTDLVGFSAWALEKGDTGALELLREVGTAVERAILQHQGRIVKRLGDGVMATFLSAQSAVDAALDAHDALEQVQVDGYCPRMRAGVHWGRPRRIGGDYLGVDVNIAARVADAAKGGEVLVSDPVFARIDEDGLRTGRSKRLKADGAPRGLEVVPISRR